MMVYEIIKWGDHPWASGLRAEMRLRYRHGYVDMIPRLCDFCRQGKAITKWGQRKNVTLSFTHWTGFDHAHCGAGRR